MPDAPENLAFGVQLNPKDEFQDVGTLVHG